MCCYLYSRTSFFDELSNYIRFIFINVFLPKHELTIEIGVIDCVHINQMDISDATQGKVLNYFTSKSSSTDNQNRIMRNLIVELACIKPILFERGWISQEGFQVGENFIQRVFRYVFHTRIILQMNPTLQQKLFTIFEQDFQVKRVSKEIQNLRELKSKAGLQTRYSLTRGVHISIFVEVTKPKLKELKKLSLLQKLQFKIVLKSSYPTEQPRVYFIIQNAIEIGINPFYDYFTSLMGQWSPKITIIDIVKIIPSFIIKCIQKSQKIVGNKLTNEFFETERLFMYNNCQTFPVKFLKSNQGRSGMLIIVNQSEIVLFEQSNFQNIYYITDFVPIYQVYSILKHKTKLTGSMLEIRRGGKKFAIQFNSDQYENIISAISDAMKSHSLLQKPQQQSQSSDDEQLQLSLKKNQTQQLIITEENIGEIESQIMILQSIVDNSPNAKNVKELVDILKKAVEFYSAKGDSRCQIYLKNLQNVMANQIMQALLASDGRQPHPKNEKHQYESIVNLI